MKIKKKIQAQILREKGFSVSEIAQNLKVSKSSVSLWVRNIKLSSVAKSRIANISVLGREKGKETNKLKRQKIKDTIGDKILAELKGLHYTIITKKISCALLYWCEGEKSPNSVKFTNSDPKLLETFLKLLRSAFDLDESRFRVCLHLHSYHDETKQKSFWSHVTGIPENQFIKTYRKKNSGIAIKKDYPGCASVRYNDVKVAIEIEKVYSIFANKI